MNKLSLFLTDLLADGNLTVPRTINEVGGDALETALPILRELYDRDMLNMPGNAPAFNKEAAIWAAKYVFFACQLILLRDVDELELQQYLQPFDGGQSPEAIYSADLLLRFLPDLFRLASGLSPADPLLDNMRQAAYCWPYSSIGFRDLQPPVNELILNNNSLRLAYIDRIIQYKDTGRLTGPAEKQLLKEVLGEYPSVLWPGLDLLIHLDNEII